MGINPQWLETVGIVTDLPATEAEVKANADQWQHLKPYGWEYIVVDIRWFR